MIQVRVINHNGPPWGHKEGCGCTPVHEYRVMCSQHGLIISYGDYDPYASDLANGEANRHLALHESGFYNED